MIHKSSQVISRCSLSLFASFSSSHTIEPTKQPYYVFRNQQLSKYMQKEDQNMDGFYCEEGINKFSSLHPSIQMKSLLRMKGIKISDIGIGTYKGSLDEKDDILQFNGIIDSILLGVNVIDSCRNFRGGRSEMVIGAALRFLEKQKKYSRNSIFIQSKAGYVREQLPSDLSQQVINGHCVHPTFLENSLNQSLDALGLKKLDVFYLNNFAQTQLETLGREKFQYKLAKAFEFMEKCRQENKINSYGLASWESFRLPPNHKNSLSLNKILAVAKNVGGPDNGFKFLQVPINLMMPEAFAEKNQQFGSLLETAEELRMNIVSSSPLLSGSLINIPLAANKLNCRNNGAKHLQIMRSIPSSSLITTLIGQKTNLHVNKNLEVLKVPRLTDEEWFNFFIPQKQAQQISP